MISTRLYNKPQNKYVLFTKVSFEVVGACDAAKKIHIFINRANQHIQEINIHFYGTLNYFGVMVFAENQYQDESYTFKDMFLQTYKSYFFLVIINDVETH